MEFVLNYLPNLAEVLCETMVSLWGSIGRLIRRMLLDESPMATNVMYYDSTLGTYLGT